MKKEIFGLHDKQSVKEMLSGAYADGDAGFVVSHALTLAGTKITQLRNGMVIVEPEGSEECVLAFSS